MRSKDIYIILKEANMLTGGGKSDGLHSDMTVIGGVRRLIEIEYERLQDSPGNYTQYSNYNGGIRCISKTNRYKLIGNAMTVGIVGLIVKRLKFIEQRITPYTSLSESSGLI